MSELETEYQQQLKELLRQKRKLLHYREMQIAQGGIYVDPSVTIARDDLEQECAEIEAKLGIVHPKVEEAPRRSVYTPPPRPMGDFMREQEQTRESARQGDVQHQQSLLRTHRGNLAHYRAQAKAYGGVDLAPPITRNGMREERAGIAQAKDALRRLGIIVDDLPGDE